MKPVKTSLTGIEDRDLPTVALVGRPNVGKSTLFNRLTRSRRAIVDPNPGMTRDRLYGTLHLEEGSLRLVDTGGLEDDPNMIALMIRSQTDAAIKEADVIVFLTDGREGLLPGDREIADALRQLQKPLILFINKMDGGDEQLFDTDIYSLGFKNVLRGSAEHNRGIERLLDAIKEAMTGAWRAPRKSPEQLPLRLAIIGRPNAGKSSLVNKLLHEERVMVSDVAGTTRDPIDTYLNYKNRPYCLVDTAGIRKRGKISGSQEHMSVLMAKRQVEQADVIAVIVDATDPGSAQDAAIAGIADDAFKPVIVVVNKWDLVEDKETNTPKQFEEKIRRRIKFLEGSTFLFVSAKTGQRVSRILDLADSIHTRMSQRVTTGVLNRFVEEIAANKRMPSFRGKLLKVYYVTQVETHPPTFVLVANTSELYFSQERFIMNRIRDAFNLEGIPLKLIVKRRERKDSREKSS